jgi:hypothetical protein
MNERLNAFGRLDYVDPKPFLLRLDAVDREVSRSQLPRKVRTLRTNELKPWREAREGALFAYAMGLKLGQTVLIAKADRQDVDYDCVTRREQPDGSVGFGPVQIKEVVPDYLNRTASIRAIVDDLARISAPDLNVLIHLNRLAQFDPTELRVESLRISTLWVIGAIRPDKSRWALWGDFLGKNGILEFDYPTSE